MAYIQDANHFINYLNKAISNSDEPISSSDTLPASFYVQTIYDAGLADQYCWDMKEQGAGLIRAEETLRWIERHKRKHILEQNKQYSYEFTEEFIDETERLEQHIGVYSFWHNDIPMYIGKSQTLGQRIRTSFAERFSNFNQDVYLRYILTLTTAAAGILEIHFINTLHPMLNAEHNKEYAKHELTLSPIPEWSESIFCDHAILETGENNGR